MKSRVEAKNEYAEEVIERLKEYESFSHLPYYAWETLKDELRYAFSAGVDFSIEKYIHRKGQTDVKSTDTSTDRS